MSNLLNPKQKARLIKSISLNVFALALCAGLFMGYILPGYDEISQKQADLIQMITDLAKTQKDGVTAAGYDALVAKYAGVRRSGARTAEDKKSLELALSRPADVSQDYNAWVTDELAKITTIDWEIEKNSRIIAGSIPTFSELAGEGGDIKNQITLADLNAYVERGLLKKYSLESFSPVGFGTISFDSKSNSLLNIGTYKLQMDVKGANKNILAMVDSIQKGGGILIKDWKLVESTSSVPSNPDTKGAPKFSNLLITIDTAIFANSLDDSEKETTANITLIFYVRARNYNDLVVIRTKLTENVVKLTADITALIELCSNTTKIECKNEGVLKTVQASKNYKNDIDELTKKLTERAKNTGVVEIGSELNTLFDMYTTYNALRSQVSAVSAQIEVIRKTLAP